MSGFGNRLCPSKVEINRAKHLKPILCFHTNVYMYIQNQSHWLQLKRNWENIMLLFKWAIKEFWGNFKGILNTFHQAHMMTSTLSVLGFLNLFQSILRSLLPLRVYLRPYRAVPGLEVKLHGSIREIRKGRYREWMTALVSVVNRTHTCQRPQCLRPTEAWKLSLAQALLTDMNSVWKSNSCSLLCGDWYCFPKETISPRAAKPCPCVVHSKHTIDQVVM